MHGTVGAGSGATAAAALREPPLKGGNGLLGAQSAGGGGSRPSSLAGTQDPTGPGNNGSPPGSQLALRSGGGL